jgi:restriction endonuclease S subunit
VAGNLSGESLNRLTFSIPKPAEQRKIADCLLSLDNHITTQNKKIEALIS